MKKKLTAVALVVCMLAIMLVGASLAYFTDESEVATNVMTTGKVSIVQNEYQRGEDGKLVAFDHENAKKLIPAVGDNNGDGKLDGPYDDAENNMFSNERNVVDKIITVTNDGNNDAFIRTLIAFVLPKLPEGFNGAAINGEYVDVVNTVPYLLTVMKEGATAGKGYTLPKEADGKYVVVEVDGVAYLVTEYYYKNDSKLAPEQESHQSLVQIYLSSKATNEDAELLVGADGNYNILAVSQAVQTEGFADAKTALDTAFGVVNSANAATWFNPAEE